MKKFKFLSVLLLLLLLILLICLLSFSVFHLPVYSNLNVYKVSTLSELSDLIGLSLEKDTKIQDLKILNSSMYPDGTFLFFKCKQENLLSKAFINLEKEPIGFDLYSISVDSKSSVNNFIKEMGLNLEVPTYEYSNLLLKSKIISNSNGSVTTSHYYVNTYICCIDSEKQEFFILCAIEGTVIISNSISN